MGSGISDEERKKANEERLEREQARVDKERKELEMMAIGIILRLPATLLFATILIIVARALRAGGVQ